jgi:hypothetical protein
LVSALTGYDNAVFISYTHVDNEPFGPDDLRWIDFLHDQLTSRLRQLFGQRVTVWRDHKLHGNDVIAETMLERLSKVAALVSICSPRYLTSEWCRRELKEFLDAARAGGGIHVGTRSRVFKVVKTPVERDELREPLDALLGYEFYEELPGEHRVREFLLNPDPEERWKFYARVDDLAQDIAALLKDLSTNGGRSDEDAAQERTVYLAEATSDLASDRDSMRRELERRGHEVLPQRALPLAADELAAAVNEDLSRAALSIHLLGSRYGARPEGEDRSIPHLQVDLARRVASHDGLAQLIWIPDELPAVEEPQAELIGALETADVGDETEVVRAPLERFKAYALERLAPPRPTAISPGDPHAAKHVYLIHEREDRGPAEAVRAQLEAMGHVVMLPLAEGAESEAREVHQESLVYCDAVLIYHGSASEHWLRMKLIDLLKAHGWGRAEPFQAKAVLMGPPPTPDKASFATREALVLDATGNSSVSVLEPFLAQLGAVATGP